MVFDSTDSYIEHMTTSPKIPMRRTNGVFVVRDGQQEDEDETVVSSFR